METTECPLVSVIMPVYNAGKYLAESIQSVIAQSYGNIEIICVDDCSTDNSLAILEMLAQEHMNLKLYALSTNKGASHARNFAIEHAEGEFILPMDADDLIASEYCELAMEVFKTNPSIAVVYSKCKKFQGTEYWNWELPEYSKERMLLNNCVFATAFFRRSDWKRFGGYDNRLIALQDYNFWLFFTENDLQFYRIDQYLFFYRQHSNNKNISALYQASKFKKTTTKLQVWLNHKALYREYFSEMDLEPLDKIKTNVKINIVGVIKIIEKYKRYNTSYKKIYLTFLGVQLGGLAWSDSKRKFFLLGRCIHTTRLSS